MGSPELLTRGRRRPGEAPGAAPSLRDRVGPLVLTAALAWLLVLGCLAVWSLAPLAIGWRPAVIVTGSMLPTIRPGDVVLVDPDAGRPARGQLLLVRDPSQPSGQVMHRVLEVKGNGTVVTKGDANPTADRTPRRPSDVEGRVRLIVPAAGRLAMLRHEPSRGDLVWAGVAVLACLTLGLVRPAR